MTINTNNVKLLISAGSPRQFPHTMAPQIAFSGRSNVGKSSLINSLLNRHSLARTSSSPGKTITINFYDVDGKLLFADLPGYGYAKRSYDSKADWSDLTDAYFTRNPSFDSLHLVLQLIDIRTGATRDDEMMIDWLTQKCVPFAFVFTKADKLSKTAGSAAKDEFFRLHPECADVPCVLYSSENGTGKDVLWQIINNAIEKNKG